MRCRKGHDVEVLHSGAGYYMGTKEDGEPFCRITRHYAGTAEEAALLPLNRQFSPENAACNSNGGCVACYKVYVDLYNPTDATGEYSGIRWRTEADAKTELTEALTDDNVISGEIRMNYFE